MNLLGSFDMFVAICDDAGIIISLFIYLFINKILKLQSKLNKIKSKNAKCKKYANDQERGMILNKAMLDTPQRLIFSKRKLNS